MRARWASSANDVLPRSFFFVHLQSPVTGFQGPTVMKLQEIAGRLGARLEPPDANADITGIAGIDSASPGQITFIANPKYAASAGSTQASAIIVEERFPAVPKPTLRSKNPQYAYLLASRLFYQPPAYPAGVHPSSVVHPSARIGANASIGPGVVIEDGVRIGDNCVLR